MLNALKSLRILGKNIILPRIIVLIIWDNRANPFQKRPRTLPGKTIKNIMYGNSF